MPTCTSSTGTSSSTVLVLMDSGSVFDTHTLTDCAFSETMAKRTALMVLLSNAALVPGM